jgi:hypothetical protein
MKNKTYTHTPLERLRHHVSGAVARGESSPVVEITTPAKHTRGPWSIEAVKDYLRMLDTGIDSGAPESIANAHLIAAAPDLLEALRGLIDQLEAAGIHIPGEDSGQWHGAEGISFSRAIEAIAKAEGRAGE